jgi:hypothetical protein
VKRFLAAVAGGIGLGALLSRYRSRRAAARPSPADELRTKLAEQDARAGPVAEEQVQPEAAEATAEEAATEEAPPGEVAGRRGDVHERARKAIDELR